MEKTVSNQTFKEFLLEKHEKDSKKKKKKEESKECSKDEKEAHEDNAHVDLVDFLNQSTVTNS